jgi:site-specific recombinase XerD
LLKKWETGESLSAVGVFQIVRKDGKLIGVPELALHDCRRAYAHLGFEAGVPITQISELLGHATVATTQKYLDLSLDLDNTASDFVPLSSD